MEASTQLGPVLPSDRSDFLSPEGEEEAVSAAMEGVPERQAGSGHSQVDGERPQASPAQASKSWELARELCKADEITEACVTGYNKGGLLVEWRGLQGFVPASQLLELSKLHVERERLRQLKQRQGQVLDLKVIEVEAASKRLIFSERATEVAASERKQLLQALEPGQVRSGVVTNLADFGAFVDLGGVEGLIHISQLSWRRLVHPGDVVRPGQMLDVLVMQVDAERERVALSRKQLRPDPWIGVEERYEPEQIVKGVVTNVADFGAFVLVEEGLEGLIHVSEMGQVPALQPLQAVREGQTVKVRVLHVSEQKRRLALSLCL